VNAALWGALSAVSFGVGDLAARFSSRALGAFRALFGTLLVGAVLVTAWVVWSAPPMAWPLQHLWLLAANGILVTLAILLLYKALARGPVSVAAPLVATYPAFVVAIAVALGARPTAIQWIAMAGVLLGAVLLGVAAEEGEKHKEGARQSVMPTVLMAGAAAAIYALSVVAGQRAVPVFGELQTLWSARVVSLAAIVVLMAALRISPVAPRRWWPVLALQGVLDTGGFLFLFIGSAGQDPEVAAVTGSCFGAVTTLLAWLVLRERITPLQWCGIVVVFAGVAVLAGQK